MDNGKKPLHRLIREALLARIQTMSADAVLATECELASEFKASRMTIHKVLSDLQKEGIVRRVKGKGTFVNGSQGHVLTGAELRPSEKSLIVAYPHWFSYDIWAKVDLATQIARTSGYGVADFKILEDTDYTPLQKLLSRREDVKGLLLIPPGASLRRQDEEILDSFGIPVVSLVSSDSLTLTRNLYAVTKDHFKAGYLAVAHLVTHGHDRIGYVPNEPWTSDSRNFYAGMKSSLYEHGLKLKDLIRPSERSQIHSSSMETGYRMALRMLRRHRPTALVVDSVPGAFGVLRAVGEMKLCAPDDLSVVVNDEYCDFEEYLLPRLTTIAVDRREMIQRAVETVIRGGRDCERVRLTDVRLNERDSVKAMDRDAVQK